MRRLDEEQQEKEGIKIISERCRRVAQAFALEGVQAGEVSRGCT
jgi:hypothetical protein